MGYPVSYRRTGLNRATQSGGYQSTIGFANDNVPQLSTRAMRAGAHDAKFIAANDNTPGGPRYRDFTRLRWLPGNFVNNIVEDVVGGLSQVVSLGRYIQHTGFTPSMYCKGGGDTVHTSWVAVCPYTLYLPAPGSIPSNASTYSVLEATGKFHNVFGWPQYEQCYLVQRNPGYTGAPNPQRRVHLAEALQVETLIWADPEAKAIYSYQPVPQPVPFQLLSMRPAFGPLPHSWQRGYAAPSLDLGTEQNPKPNPEPAPNPNPNPKPPPDNEKEKKFITAQGGILRILQKAGHATTEAIDGLDAIYDALPGRIKAELGKNPTPQEKAKAIWDNLDAVNWQKAFKNLIRNHYLDLVIGRASAKADMWGLKHGVIWGNSIGPKG